MEGVKRIAQRQVIERAATGIWDSGYLTSLAVEEEALVNVICSVEMMLIGIEITGSEAVPFRQVANGITLVAPAGMLEADTNSRDDMVYQTAVNEGTTLSQLEA